MTRRASPSKVCNFSVFCSAEESARAEPTPASKEDDAQLLRTIAMNGEVVVCVAKTTSVVSDAIRRHATANTGSAALGRGLTAVMLLASFRGEGEQVQLTLKGGGPLGTMTVMSDNLGQVRGMLQYPQAQVPFKADGTLDVATGIGITGTLRVVRSLPTILEPYTGVVSITSGEVAEDIAVYLRDSEQQNSAIGVGVSIEPDGTCGAAGGFFVQILPFTGDETIEQLEKNISNMPSINELITSGVSLHDITERILEGIGSSPGAQERTPVYGPCSLEHLRPRMLKAIAAIPPVEIVETIEEVGSMELTCEFCKETIQFCKADLTQLLV